MKRVSVFIYGALTYILFLGVFLYAIGFVGNILVPKSIDSQATNPIGTAVLVDALLLGLFAVQHTIMARSGFKKLLTRVVPPQAERSTFVLATNIVFLLLFWQWRPVGGTIWHVENALGAAILSSAYWIGWGTVLISTFLIDHFDLFGLRQVTNYLLKREPQYPRFVERSLYKVIRHPIMLGFIIAFWATPNMTVGRLLFAGLATGYILVGIMFEERDLIKHHGEVYLQYASRVPRLIPFIRLGRSGGDPKLQLKEDAMSN
jgi:protein-S-isoprenylcysteine O-methyltransferase Ste14